MEYKISLERRFVEGGNLEFVFAQLLRLAESQYNQEGGSLLEEEIEPGVNSTENQP